MLTDDQLIQELKNLEKKIKRLRREVTAKSRASKGGMKEEREAAVQRILGSETDFYSWEIEKKMITKKRIEDIESSGY